MIREFYFIFQFISLLCFSDAKLISVTTKPQPAKSFNLTYIQNVRGCSYNVVISTSCSSPRYTRDEISIAFGDGYGNQIYAPRIDDPATRTFEQCSTDTFEISGPCAYQICYVYLYRTGPDGWKPDSVKIYALNSRAVSFYYNAYIPSDIWYGFDYCSNANSSTQHVGMRWFWFLVSLGLAFLL